MDEATIEEIKARTDLAELVESYGISVRHAGSSAKACCPFHHEKTPSFNINVAKGFYHCFGCGESGDAISFVQKQEGLTFVEAAKKLAERCGVKVEERREDPEAGRRKRLLALMAELAAFYRRCLLKMREAQPARDYLEKRALGDEIQEAWTIGYAPSGVATVLKWAEKYGYTADELAAAGVIKAGERPGDLGYHRFGGRLMFSIRDRQGRVVAFSGRQIVERKNAGKYVNSPETIIFKKSNVLFGFDRAAANIVKAPHREALVCEGQIDTIRLHACGFPVAVASQGTAFTEEHARMLKRVADQVVLVFDDDAAGHKATIRTAGILLAAEMPVRVVSLPNGDDPDSFLRTKGAAEFQKLLDGAESIMSFQCRVEQAKEANPKSIDGVARISRAVLATLANCPNEIFKASLTEEAARLLGLPVAALREELAKTKGARPASGGAAPYAPRRSAPVPVPVSAPEPEPDGGDEGDFEDEPFDDADFAGNEPSDAATDGDGEDSDAGEDAHAALPPSDLEQAFMAFLMANERDEKLDGMLGELLPQPVFENAFTWRFLENWRMELATDDDVFAAFAASLAARERRWFDAVLVAAERSEASTLSRTDILQEFVRRLWKAAVRRRRGALPASGDVSAEIERLRLTAILKRLDLAKWHDVKELVRDLACT